MNGVKKIFINSTDIKFVGAKIFKNISPNAVIKVPQNKIYAYKRSEENSKD